MCFRKTGLSRWSVLEFFLAVRGVPLITAPTRGEALEYEEPGLGDECVCGLNRGEPSSDDALGEFRSRKLKLRDCFGLRMQLGSSLYPGFIRKREVI